MDARIWSGGRAIPAPAVSLRQRKRTARRGSFTRFLVDGDCRSRHGVYLRGQTRTHHSLDVATRNSRGWSSLHLRPARGCDARENQHHRRVFATSSGVLSARGVPPSVVRRALSKREPLLSRPRRATIHAPAFSTETRGDAMRGARPRECHSRPRAPTYPGVRARGPKWQPRSGCVTELAFFSFFLSYARCRATRSAGRTLPPRDTWPTSATTRAFGERSGPRHRGIHSTRVEERWRLRRAREISWRIKFARRRFRPQPWIRNCSDIRAEIVSHPRDRPWFSPAGSAVPDRNGDCKGPARSAGSAQNEHEVDRFRSRDPFQSSRVAPFEQLFAGWFCRRMLGAARGTDARWLWPWRASQREPRREIRRKNHSGE